MAGFSFDISNGKLRLTKNTLDVLRKASDVCFVVSKIERDAKMSLSIGEAAKTMASMVAMYQGGDDVSSGKKEE